MTDQTRVLRGDLSVEAQARYAFVEELVRADWDPPARVVELGAAPGDQIARFASLGYQALAVDIDEAPDAWGSGEIGRMQRLFNEAGVTYIAWNLESVPYPMRDASADAIVMTEVFEHLRDYPIRSLMEAGRILAPGGRLYFTTPNQTYLVNRLRLLAGRNIATPLEDWIGGLIHARHAREYTFGEIDELMRRAGLRVVTRCSRHFNVDSGRTGRLAGAGKRALSRLAERRPTLGPQIIVVAERAP
jgi:SAM-dependent methyltransferase